MNSLNTLNGAGPQVGTMVNVCQIPKRSYTADAAAAGVAELRATWSRSAEEPEGGERANCQYCKAMASARERHFYLQR